MCLQGLPRLLFLRHLVCCICCIPCKYPHLICKRIIIKSDKLLNKQGILELGLEIHVSISNEGMRGLNFLIDEIKSLYCFYSRTLRKAHVGLRMHFNFTYDIWDFCWIYQQIRKIFCWFKIHVFRKHLRIYWVKLVSC